MDTDELTDDDEPESMDDEATYRDRAAAKLDQIAQDAKQALAEHDIKLSVFFVIPANGSILMFGTDADPSDDLWHRVSEIVSAVVRQSIGLDQSRCRSLVCAVADTAPITC